jgi:hypothetical protein
MNGLVFGIVLDHLARGQRSDICLPDPVNTDQVRETIIGFLAAHPDFWTADGNAAVGVALETSFPCPKSN